MKKQTLERIRHQKKIFCNLNSIRSLCELLKVEQRKLELLAQHPQYKTFTIPKKNGGQRQIEAPEKTHKIILGRLNTYLQSAYYFEKSSASYGFILGVKNDDDRRSVVTNARKHCRKKYMVNIDLKDFDIIGKQSKATDTCQKPAARQPNHYSCSAPSNTTDACIWKE